jgi:hypothetical protein
MFNPAAGVVERSWVVGTAVSVGVGCVAVVGSTVVVTIADSLIKPQTIRAPAFLFKQLIKSPIQAQNHTLLSYYHQILLDHHHHVKDV